MSAWYLSTLAFASASWAIAVWSLLSATLTIFWSKLDLGLLLLMVFVQLGDKNLRHGVAFLHLLADVYVIFLDKARDLGVYRRLFVGFHEARLVYRASQVAQFRLDHVDLGDGAHGACRFGRRAAAAGRQSRKERQS